MSAASAGSVVVLDLTTCAGAPSGGDGAGDPSPHAGGALVASPGALPRVHDAPPAWWVPRGRAWSADAPAVDLRDGPAAPLDGLRREATDLFLAAGIGAVVNATWTRDGVAVEVQAGPVRIWLVAGTVAAALESLRGELAAGGAA